MAEISIADLDQAEAELRDAKESGDQEWKKTASENLASLRQAYRTQEEAAGRRGGIVGGDASV